VNPREEHAARVKEFLVPDLGEGLTDATIINWDVAVGDDVVLNQTLCTLETNKANVEIPSPYAGRIVALGGAEGDTLDVGTMLVRIDAAADAPPQSQPTVSRDGAGRRPVLVGYGADEDADSSRRMRASEIRPVHVERPRAAPAVRKLAAELGVDLAGVLGSGADGVITRDDVLAAGTPAEDVSAPDVQPVRGVQARMAKQMMLSRSRIPDAHARVTVDCSALLRLRDRLAVRDGEDTAAVTPFALVLRLVVLALTHHERLNSTWVDAPDGPQIHLHRGVNLGFGVATDRGLLVPVLADAHRLTIRQLARRVADLIRGARDGVLAPTQLQGSTFTVSNFGALGLDDGVPVINYPEAAILGMGSLKPRPVVVDGTVVARPTMALTCAFDHRVADGAQVALFLNELRQLIEVPELALLDS
jgi:pyruvate dehydrogenase E2 component (dihydrolipoamide acetyltransferase)